MIIKKSVFVKSSVDVKKCPEALLPEYAFIGRSNVGKSSLINMLCNRKNLAKISSQPGKTQLINHFLINDKWYLVDLPGYGFAKVPKHLREKWEKFITSYIFQRKNLISLFTLIDSRIPPQQNDLNFMYNLGIHQIPFVIVFTKTDKLKKNEKEKNLAFYKKELLKTWESLPEIIMTSATDKTGRDDILHFIEKNNKNFSEK